MHDFALDMSTPSKVVDPNELPGRALVDSALWVTRPSFYRKDQNPVRHSQIPLPLSLPSPSFLHLLEFLMAQRLVVLPVLLSLPFSARARSGLSIDNMSRGFDDEPSRLRRQLTHTQSSHIRSQVGARETMRRYRNLSFPTTEKENAKLTHHLAPHSRTHAFDPVPPCGIHYNRS